jgi:hypothetical protein
MEQLKKVTGGNGNLPPNPPPRNPPQPPDVPDG